MAIATRLATAVLALLLAGCMQMSPDYEQPTVTVSSFRAVPGNGPGLNFAVDLKVINPNREPLELQGVAYTISVEGRKLITGVGKDLPVIDGYSEGTISLTASASMMQGLRLLGDLMDSPNRDTLSYELDTKLDVGTFYPAIRVKDVGEFQLNPSR